MSEAVCDQWVFNEDIIVGLYAAILLKDANVDLTWYKTGEISPPKRAENALLSLSRR